MRSTLFANSTDPARAALQTAWVGIGAAVALRSAGVWNYESAVQYLPPCLFHLVTDVDCPGCGMTRAFLRLAQGDFAGAWGFHPFSPLLALLLLVLAWGPKAAQSWLRHSYVAQKVAIVALAALLGWWSWVKLLPLVGTSA